MEETEDIQYKSFKELGIDVKGEKCFFNCKRVKMDDIIDKDIVLEDFTMNISTSFGNNRIILCVKILETNELCKVFTSSKYLKEILDKITDKAAMLPIKTKINKIEPKKGTHSYIFN